MLTNDLPSQSTASLGQSTSEIQPLAHVEQLRNHHDWPD